jgi:uncharacterized membrane protein
MKDLIISAVLLVLIDSLYLSSIKGFFDKQVMSVQKSPLQVDLLAAILCYLVLIIGLYYFIISKKKPVYEAFLLGFVIYMVFELTNKAILKNWKWNTVLLDGIWGGILFATTTFITYKLYRLLD